MSVSAGASASRLQYSTIRSTDVIYMHMKSVLCHRKNNLYVNNYCLIFIVHSSELGEEKRRYMYGKPRSTFKIPKIMRLFKTYSINGLP